MSQHYTRNTSQVLTYCPTCNRKTMHRVDDRRIGPCLEHEAQALTKKQERIRQKLQEEQKQGDLFR